ncbi:MAG: COX15/CtaA family protein [Egibacteraceae bacterium]
MPQPVPGHRGDSPRLPAPFRRLTVATVIVSLVLVAVGGVVRATDSGLACPTWPGCLSVGDFVPPAELHVWIEHTHRLVAGVLLVMIAAQLGWAWMRFRSRPEILWSAGIAAALVLAQAALGAIVVLLRLRAELVTAHLGLAMALIGVLLFLAVAAARPSVAGISPLARTAAVVAGIAYVQILLGGHMSGKGTGLAYVQRPLLGVFALGPVQGEAEAVNVAHRVLAVVLVGGVMALAATARRAGAAGWPLRLPRIAAWLVTIQVALGIANLASRLSFLAVIPHLAVASWLWAALVLEALLASRTATAQPAEPARTAVGAAL